MRNRPRNRVSFEPLAIPRELVNAFFGVTIEEQPMPNTSSAMDTPTETESKRESTNYDMHVTDNPLWRTMMSEGKINQTPTETESKRGSTSSNMHVTDNSLWRTTVGNHADTSRTTVASDDKRESTNYNFNVTDNTLWRTMPTNQNGSQTLIEVESKRESTTYNMHVTDNQLWRTMVGNDSATQSSIEVESKRESTTYNMHVSDNPLWRTITSNRGDVTRTTDKRESTNYDFNVTDNTLWRTIPSSEGQNDAESKCDSTAFNMHVTDNQLWRTMAGNQMISFATENNDETANLDQLPELEKENQTENKRESIAFNFNVSKNSNEPNSKRESVNSDLHVSMPPYEMQAHAFGNSFMDAITRRSVLSTVPEESSQPSDWSSQQTQATQRLSHPDFDSLAEKDAETTPKAEEAVKSPSFARPYVNFHFATPTKSSLAKTNEDTSNCGRCERSAEKTASMAQLKKSRQSVEAFTQTSAHNKDRRRTVLQLMHEKSPGPGLPRRSLFMPPPNITNYQRRATNLAPFFRLSTGSDSSTPKRTSVSSTTADKESPVRSKIPQRSPRSLPSTKSTNSRRSTASSPRLADRVRVSEAYKSLNGTPVTSKLPVLVSPKTRTPPTSKTSRNEEPTQIVQLSNALQQIGIDYKTPNTTPRPTASKNRSELNSSTSTPTRSNFFNSLFNATQAKSGKIPYKQATLNPNANPCALFDIGESLDDSSAQYEGPLSQQIPSQQPPTRKPFSLLNDDDFTLGSPNTPRVRRPARSSVNVAEVARCIPHIPEDLRFSTETPPRFSLANDEVSAMSFASGGSSRDSDLDSPAPKHIVLRNKPQEKKDPYMYAQPPKIVKGTDELADEHPNLRRSKRTRFTRKLRMGEKPIYDRDENGDYCLVGVQKGYTADPLCKKFSTFNKDEAMEMQKLETRRRKRIREQKRAQRAELNKKYGVVDENDSS